MRYSLVIASFALALLAAPVPQVWLRDICVPKLKLVLIVLPDPTTFFREAVHSR